MTQQNQSNLTTMVSRFSVCIAVIGAFYAAPWIVRYFRADMFDYLKPSLGTDIAYWGAWIFIGVVVLATLFGAAAILQLLLNTLIRKISSTQLF